MCTLYRNKKKFQIEWALLQDFYIINISYKKNNATTMPISIKPYSIETREAYFSSCNIWTQPAFNNTDGIRLVKCYKRM